MPSSNVLRPFKDGASVVGYFNSSCSSAVCRPLSFSILYGIAWWPSAGEKLFARLSALDVLFYVV